MSEQPTLSTYAELHPPHLDADVQEALSKRYSNSAIIIIPLSSKRLAVFNRAFQLCGIVVQTLAAFEVWYPPGAKP